MSAGTLADMAGGVSARTSEDGVLVGARVRPPEDVA
jgi:hypothetical protein